MQDEVKVIQDEVKVSTNSYAVTRDLESFASAHDQTECMNKSLNAKS